MAAARPPHHSCTIAGCCGRATAPSHKYQQHQTPMPTLWHAARVSPGSLQRRLAWAPHRSQACLGTPRPKRPGSTAGPRRLDQQLLCSVLQLVHHAFLLEHDQLRSRHRHGVSQRASGVGAGRPASPAKWTQGMASSRPHVPNRDRSSPKMMCLPAPPNSDPNPAKVHLASNIRLTYPTSTLLTTGGAGSCRQGVAAD